MVAQPFRLHNSFAAVFDILLCRRLFAGVFPRPFLLLLFPGLSRILKADGFAFTKNCILLRVPETAEIVTQ